MDKNRSKLFIIGAILFFMFIFPLIARNGLGGLIVLLAVIFILSRFWERYKGNFSRLNINPNIMPTIDVEKLKERGRIKRTAFSILAVIFLVWLFFASIQVIDAGETGVYSLFGKVRDQELRSGFHLVIPLARVTRMSIRTEEYTMSVAQSEGRRLGDDSIDALTKEGLNVKLDLTVLFRLNEDQASDVYRGLGLTYDEKLIRPSIRTAIRDVVASYDAKAIYSDKRDEVTGKIEERIKSTIEPRGVTIENVLMRNVVLPDNLAKAIQEKLQADQEAQKYDFILQKEKKEKERKVIEAEGQRESQRIINESLTTNYLYYSYINQLKDRQGTIYVPTSPDTGMPLFRNIGQ